MGMCSGAVTMTVVFLLIVLGMTTSAAQEYKQSYDGVRYSVFSKRLSWPQAMASCQEQSSTLATPTNYHHATFLVTHTADLDAVWLGAQSAGGVWRWEPLGPDLSAQPQPNLFPPWEQPPPPQANLCLALRRTPAGLPLFQHRSCSDQLSFVCQQPASGPPGWREHSAELDGRLYSFRPQPATWKQADKDCQLMGASLLAMNDINSTAFIAEHARYVALMWLGARRSDHGWEWTSSLESVPPARRGRPFPLWTYPDKRHLPGHDCLAVDLRNPEKPMFVPRPCTEALVFACERADREYQQYIKTIYLPDRKIMLIEGRQAFDEALKTCAQYEGALATLNKPHLLKQVQPYSKKFAGLWVGARSDDKGVVRWLATGEEAPVFAERSLVLWEEDTEVLVTHDQFRINARRYGDLPYTFFRRRRNAVSSSLSDKKPSGGRKKPSKVCMQLNKNGIFVESACHIKRSFACETRANVSLLESEKLTFGNVNYLVVTSKFIWDEASEICKNNNGQLAQLGPSENQSLTKIAKEYENLWLGGQVKDSEWLWDDGSKIPQPGTEVAATTAERRCVGVPRIGPHQPVKLEAWSCEEQHGFLCRTVG